MRDSEDSGGRWMGLDVGSKRIGVALSDPLKVLALPLTTLQRVGLEADARKIVELARRHGVQRLIVGLPRRLDGRAGTTLEQVRALADRIAEVGGMVVDWCDERLSTREAEELMAEAGVPARLRRKRRDEFAAAVILRRRLQEQSR